MRAPRDLLRRRTHLRRKRAALLAHVQPTHRPYNLPAIGTQIASKANREGVAERVAAPAVPKNLEVDLALITYDDEWLRALALAIVQTAQPHDAHTRDLLQTVPGLGQLLRLGLLYASHRLDRFPGVQAFAAYGRLVHGRKESGGKHVGTSGKQSGHAHLTWAFAEAAVLCLRNNEAGPKSLARWEKKHTKGQALSLLAQNVGRAVSDMLKRQTAFAMALFLRTSGSRAGELAVALATQGMSLQRVCRQGLCTASVNAQAPLGP